MRRRILVTTLVGAAFLGACTDDNGGAIVGAEDLPAATTSTTAVPVTTTTSTTLPQTPLPTGREAIDAVLAAWQAGDPVAASLVASPEAVAALFAIAPEPAEDRGCNTGNVQVNVQCVFRLSVGELQVRAAPTADGSGFLVDFVILGS